MFVCNQADTDFYFAVAREKGWKLGTTYELNGWIQVKPVSCFFFEISKDSLFLAFAQKDRNGHLVMAPYLSKLFRFPEGFTVTDQQFCVKQSGKFSSEQKARETPECGAGFIPATFPLHVDGELYARPHHWIQLYFLPEENPAATRRTAHGEAVIVQRTYGDFFQTGLHREAVSKLVHYKLPPINNIQDDGIRARAKKLIDDLNTQGYQMIECVYGPEDWGGKGFRHFVFWYEVVPVTRREVLTISEDNPLWLLGKVAVNTCPDTHETARIVHKYALGLVW